MFKVQDYLTYLKDKLYTDIYKYTHNLLSVIDYARILTKCGDRNYPSINLLKKLHWLPDRQRITYKILILTFKAYHKTTPQYICDLIIARTYNRAVRSNNSFALVVPMNKLKHNYCYSLFVIWGTIF